MNELTVEGMQALGDRIASKSGALPKISVIMPVYNTQPELLDRAIGSVRNQLYENWELCIANDASSNRETGKSLHRWAKRDNRIKLLHRRRNGGISAATNDAASLATGEFLAFLDHDDELTPDALAEIALRCSESSDVDMVYSDDDKIDVDGVQFAPQFKPDWSPTLLLSYMYMSHVFVVRRALFDELGGFRLGFEGSQDYDFALRASELARRVEHVPKVLYHWRVVPGSTAASGEAKPESFERGRRAVAEAFQRRGLIASVRQPKWAAQAKVGIFAPEFPHDGPRVAVIIPTRNGQELLENCIESLKQTLYRNYEIVVIDNDSDDPAMQAYLADLPHKVLRIGNPAGQGFNFAHLNNAAAQSVDAEYVLFLNNDTVVRNPEWLSHMVGYAGMAGVGAVGARLHFPDDTIQHAGVVHGHYQGLAGPAFRNAPSSDAGYLAYAYVSREYSAVTAACMLTRRSLFLDVGGFDAECFGVAYNDVDYCYRLVDLGYRCIYCATAELYHAEGKSRGFADNPREIATFRAKHNDRRDPWYNPNLSLDDEHFKVQPHHAPAHREEPIRAIMVTHNLNFEGAPNSQLELVRGLARSGVVRPLVLSPCDGPLRARYEAAGIEVQIIRNPLVDSPPIDEYEQRLSELGNLYRRHGGELVYANTLQNFWAIDAAEKTRLPTIWNSRESEPWETYFDWLPPHIRERAYQAFDHPYRIIFVSAATRQVWTPVERAYNFTVIHNGLDRSRFDTQLAGFSRSKARAALGLAPEELAVVLVGTVCERKGQVDLVKAVAQMAPPLLERFKFFIVGDRPGPYSEELKNEWRALAPDAQRRVEIVPENGQIAKYFRAADISVCTSRIESYPRVVLEAMAAGLPIVTTPVFGTREQVKEGVNALLYEPGNVSALAAHLTRLAGDPELRTTLANNSTLVLASLTTYPEMIRRYGQIFNEARFSKGTPWRPPMREG